MKIAITGPGRSGTTLLVQLFSKMGFKTPTEETYNEEIGAGLENRIDGESNYEIDKDPWLFEYINSVDIEKLNKYSAFIIPIRKREDAVISRLVEERRFKFKNFNNDYYKWDSWGTVPAGAVADISMQGISSVLSEGFWDVIEKLEENDLKIILISFPRFAFDFQYFWSKLEFILSTKINENQAKKIWDSIVDGSKIHQKSNNSEKDLKNKELTSLLEVLKKDFEKLSIQKEMTVRLQNEIEILQSQLNALKESKVKKYLKLIITKFRTKLKNAK